ncbi:uncharacterized protein YtpQ (UPF0354 family) [Bacillus oleivorans]|uniref:UPF0354 protein SAMN05877753_105140 n=1 Tax=Bacillus oleivorans TaxID=1448271 RepID=A0A285CWF6_9BACI|nr:uncharacterized protein YtpQ (UPF0354 family) [Bacillus oleivorans]
MKMNTLKMKQILEEKLKEPNRTIRYDREHDALRIENRDTGKGITVSLSSVVNKWNEIKEKAIEEIVYYVNEALTVMGKEHAMDDGGGLIFPVIRSTSFPTQSEDGVRLLFDNHTAETRIYYALDLGKSYRLIDEKWLGDNDVSPQTVREMAKFNVRSLDTEMKQDVVAGNTFYFLNSNDGYDASRILNDIFLRTMSEKIKGTMTVSVPHQDVLIIGDIQNETGYDVLAQMTMSFFTNGYVPITALSFLYQDGEFEPIFILGKNKPPTE